MNVNVTKADIEKAFTPYVRKAFGGMDLDWKLNYSRLSFELKIKRLRHDLFGFVEKFRRTQSGLEPSYSEQWLMTPIEEQISAKANPVHCVWGDRNLLALSIGIKRVHQLYLIEAIRALKPKKVLEVGAGNGLNLFVLSGIFPDVEFTGLELTKGGVEAAKSLQKNAEIPAYIEAFASQPILDKAAHKRVKFTQGNALAMPFANSEFDLVFTSLALEQMEEIRDQALKEISRVCKNHTLMIEPFYDSNKSGLRRDYIVANDYFSASVGDLSKYNLKPLFFTSDFPHKLNLGVGVALASKT